MGYKYLTEMDLTVKHQEWYLKQFDDSPQLSVRMCPKCFRSRFYVTFRLSEIC